MAKTYDDPDVRTRLNDWQRFARFVMACVVAIVVVLAGMAIFLV